MMVMKIRRMRMRMRMRASYVSMLVKMLAAYRPVMEVIVMKIPV